MAEESSFDAGEYRGELASLFVPPPPAPAAGLAAYELRPLTTGEILDRTFYLYRGNFWLFAGISAVAAAAATLTSIGQLVYAHFSHAGGPSATLVFRNATAAVIALLAVVVYLVVYGVAHAATVSAVASLYLGDRTSMAAAFRSVMGKWPRYVGISLWQIWSSMWLFMVLVIPLSAGSAILGVLGGTAALVGFLAIVLGLGSLVFGAISYIRNSLAVPVEVMEKPTVRAAMRRSKTLAAGSKGRIFLLGLLLFALYVVAGAVQMPIGMLVAKAGPGQASLLQICSIFVSFIMTMLVTPVGAIGLCLFYIDQRVRKEGFDIEFMLERSGPVVAEVPIIAEPMGETP